MQVPMTVPCEFIDVKEPEDYACCQSKGRQKVELGSRYGVNISGNSALLSQYLDPIAIPAEAAVCTDADKCSHHIMFISRVL